MYLFKKENVKRFFQALESKGRNCEPRYKGWDKNNPHIEYCERTVFVRRLAKKFLQSKYIKIYDTENNLFKFIFVSKIDYRLDYGCNIEVWYLDYSRLDLGFQTKKLDSGDVIYLEGEFSDGEEHKQLLNILKLNLPEKTFRFKAYDFDKYPKRMRKGTDPKEKIKTTVDIVARTIEEAFKKRKDFKNSLMITEEFEIL